MRFNQPIIGLAGAIGSGKSTVAKAFASLGCAVFDSDEMVGQAYGDFHIVQQLQHWWGERILTPGGQVDRQFIADHVFADAHQRRKLEDLLHPWIAEQRERGMAELANDPQVLAFVWDSPLLFETNLDARCDAVVFVDCPLEMRLARLAQARGWTADEVERREKAQWPLDKKKEMSDYVVDNTAAADGLREQVRQVLFKILSGRSADPK